MTTRFRSTGSRAFSKGIIPSIALPHQDSAEGFTKFKIIRRMPYRRRRYRRRRNFKNYRRYSGSPNAGRIALRKVVALERQQEEKYVISTNIPQIPIGGAAIIDGIGPYMARGDDINTRTGNKITVKSITVRVQVRLTAIEALGTTVRLMLVYDRRPVGADAGITNMLIADDFLSPYQVIGNDKGRFQFMADRTISFDTNDTKWSDAFFLRKSLDIEYDGNAGTVADVQKGNFLIVGMAQGNAAAIDIDYYARIKFTDD